MGVSVFLSYPKPFTMKQEQFIERLISYLESRGLAPRTLGRSDYDLNAPLSAIRRLMLESNGLITIAFKRYYVSNGAERPNTASSKQLTKQWFTSPWSQIEPAMAFQIGLPILIAREKGVIADGVLEKGVAGTYMPEFDLDVEGFDYLNSSEWMFLVGQWEGYVRKVVDFKGRPPIQFCGQ